MNQEWPEKLAENNVDDDSNNNNNPRQVIYRIRVSFETEEQHKKNAKTDVKYLPLDERIPYSVIDMTSEELTPCVKTQQKTWVQRYYANKEQHFHVYKFNWVWLK